MLKKLFILMLISITTNCLALTPKDPRYCQILEQIKPNMEIGDVFLILGPPHSFGQPPNLNMNALNTSTEVARPQNTISNQNTPEARQRVLASIEQDPILGAFMNAPPNYSNVLIWEFENNALNVSVKVRGSTVTDVKTNFSCE